MSPVVSGIQSAPIQSSTGGNNTAPDPEFKHEDWHAMDPVASPTMLDVPGLNTEDSDDKDEAVDNSTTDDGGQQMLTLLTAADVELDMDEEVEENDVVDKESEPSGDEMD